jgi:hypothetical protein
MSQPPLPERKPASAPIVAGALIVASMILCAAVGFGLGALVGHAVLVGLAGLFVGLLVGFALVHDRYRDL